ALRRSRSEKAARIEVLEREVDRYHEALHAADEQTGLTYRELIGELIGVEAAGPYLNAAALRPLLARLDRGGVAALDETCAPLVRLWLDANYEDSPLAVLQGFAVDAAVTESLHAGLAAIAMAERLRDDVVARGAPMFDLEEVEPHQAWLNAQAGALRELPDAARADLRAWFDLFQASGALAPRSQALIAEAGNLERALGALDSAYHDASLFTALNGLPEPKRAARFAAAAAAGTPAATFMQRLSLGRWRSRRVTRAYLAGLGQAAEDGDFRRLAAALALEGELRPLRQRVGALQQALGASEPNAAATLHDLRQAVRAMAAALASVSPAAAAILAAPRRREAEAIARMGTRAAVDHLLAGYELAFARLAARQASAARLNALAAWFDPAWMASCAKAIEAHASNQDRLAAIVRRLPELAAYQRFRARAAVLSPQALQAFACLRPHATAIAALPASDREGLVQRTLQRESLLAWRTRFEAQWPELEFEREEIARKVASLAILDAEMRTLNRQLLVADIDAGRLGTATAWESITRLRGARALRLREILDQGAELGLMRLRPVWLMNPDVASRLLPLRPGLFDVVIFDEASQMPVEHATPALFRARRAVISGDEKQMPPSSFFSSRIDGDDDDSDAGNIEETTDAARAAHADQWNRRDVQSCPDLLQLGRSVLPVAALQIHYRSAYRELIGYSNAAFYNHTLNVPARHPDDEVRRAAPIEVLRVDGVYEEQTNPAEAERVVAVLEQLWAQPADQRPSVGVVTFNRKQADCVEDAIRARADEDPAFLQALHRERDRTQRGEDMGFFVKNVENVQGDERDVIIFSTTFGRNHQGTFRRSFGVLGQAGGERRLNVAVTRARNKVILITSMPVNDVSDWLAAGRAPATPRDYLQAYLDYAAKISRGDLDAARSSQGRLGQQARRIWRSGADGPDGFAASVAAFIRSLGHQPIPAAQDGDAFGLDFAIEHPETGLFGIGIECDAPRHPLLARARAREIWRPAVLGRSVPRLHRVSSVSWYGRRAEEEARLRHAVEEAMGMGLRA
ncbi:AAA domain-containing protein, partial [Methylobacterium sp. WL9]|uniref:AAA domain-containing protein n=1 Tax=Methylobacterium sp. WL9 TaxID=2603898 RepID=UPI0011D9F364